MYTPIQCCTLMYMSSRIVTETITNLLHVFSGNTVTLDQISEQLEMEYAMSRKRSAYGSYVQIIKGIEHAGVTSRYTGPDYTGVCLYTFPKVPA